ncbi:GLPGLI family protein [Polaribacter sp. ALD11]|uniref:GLPGLI family protein n=1 Tax=Polaribacter sp. ALD11 TaxID=2058137 RepID=UPI000C316A19|nr:GLPGLI family protein [Polaribacter sp. ALD11]AUC85672.1 GLPGLI family protein [Polaribacter sp. ALD11]
MKKIILSLVLFSTFVCFSQGRITYSVSFNGPDFSKLEKKKVPKERIDRIKKAIRDSKDVEALLLFNNKESLYYVKEDMKNDSKKAINYTKLFAGNNEKFYQNYNDKDFFYQTGVLGDLMLVEMPPIKWKLTQETKKVGNYICYKAINLDSKDQKTIAWYTQEIPVRYGPKKYFGLPGLILELQESSNFTFTAIKIELNIKDIEIEKPKGLKKLTAEEYKELIKKNSPFKN